MPRFVKDNGLSLVVLALFLITLVLNLIALTVVRRYREAYE